MSQADAINDVIKDTILDELEWVIRKKDWKPLLKVIRDWYDPDEIYTDADLADWAQAHGFVKAPPEAEE